VTRYTWLLVGIFLINEVVTGHAVPQRPDLTSGPRVEAARI
jgi:hypothetical protein